MNIESLQIKRVTGNWNTHKNYKPASGELVLINVNNEFTVASGMLKINTKSNPIIVVGDGATTLSGLMGNTSTRMYLSSDSVKDLALALVDTETTPKDILSGALVGTNFKASPSDHTHGVKREVLERVLGTNADITSFSCRKIKMGTKMPDSNEGSVGDIYIKYES